MELFLKIMERARKEKGGGANSYSSPTICPLGQKKRGAAAEEKNQTYYYFSVRYPVPTYSVTFPFSLELTKTEREQRCLLFFS